MKRKVAFVLAFSVLRALSVALAGDVGSQPLREVLSLVPALVSSPLLAFTDWSLIKAYTGLEEITSKSPIKERLKLVQATTQDQAAAAGYALTYFINHAEVWGWDTTDLTWEANLTCRELSPVHFLKFEGGFDFAPILTRFEERGFVQTASYGIPIYSHTMDTSAEWLRATELAILNTAVLEEERLFILSSSDFAVRAVLATRAGEIPSLRESEAAISTVESLGKTAAAMLLLGADTCLGFTQSPLLDLIETIPNEEAMARLKALLEEHAQLSPYQALGVGYCTEEGRPVGRLVFHYLTSEEAAHDLPLRRALAEEGFSQSRKAPYSEVLFTLKDATVNGGNLVFRVRPINEQPQRLFQMILYRDMGFAACP